MNQSQKKYAIERIDDLLCAKLIELKKICTTPGKSLTSEERIKLIRSKKVWLKPESALSGLDRYALANIHKVFNFSKYEYPSILDREKYEPIADVIQYRATRIKDQIMLGSASEALKMVHDFEKFTGRP